MSHDKVEKMFLVGVTKKFHITFHIHVFHLRFSFGGDHLSRCVPSHFSLFDCYFACSTFSESCPNPLLTVPATMLRTPRFLHPMAFYHPMGRGFPPNYDNFYIIIFLLMFINSYLVTLIPELPNMALSCQVISTLYRRNH